MKAVSSIIFTAIILAGPAARLDAGCGGCDRAHHNQCVGSDGMFCRCCVLTWVKGHRVCGNQYPGTFCWGCGSPWGSCPGGGDSGCTTDYESFCCVPTKTCADYPGQCGTFPNGCSGVHCGCPAGKVCDVGTCCTPKTCAADYPGLWGSLSNGCGGNITCSCPAGQTQLAGGICQPPYTELFKVRCLSGAIQDIVGSATEVSPLRIKKGAAAYYVALVPIGHADQSCLSVRTSTSTFRLRKKTP